MGDANGGTPGRLVRLFGNFSTLAEFPTNPPPGFNPHGFAIDATRQRLVSADYLDLKSTLTKNVKPQFLGSGAFQYRHSLRVWQLPNFTQPNANLSLVGEFVTGMLPKAQHKRDVATRTHRAYTHHYHTQVKMRPRAL